MANSPKKSQRSHAEVQRAAVTARRTSARRQREQRRQRLVIGIAGGAIGVALLALVIGVLYDQVFLPSRPVAQVANTTLSRSQYNTERRLQIARDIYGTLDLLNRFGAQFGEQFAQRIPQLNAEADPQVLRSGTVDPASVNDWVDRTLIEQGASELSVQADDGEVAQALVSSLSTTFPALPTAPVSGTTTATATGAITSTDAVTAEATVEPTATTAPTPEAAAAVQQEDAVLQRLYDAYTAEIVNTRPSLQRDDFKQGLRDQFRRQVLTEKIQAQLVPETGFTASTEPTSIAVRHILVKVETPEGASDGERDAAFAARRAEAEAILAEAKGSADFATLAQERSEDLSTKDNGGSLSSFDTTGKTEDGTQVDPAFLEAALALTEPNQIADQVVRTPFGWHIIQLERRTVPSLEDQLADARTEAFDKWLQERRAATNIQRFPPETPTATLEPTPEGTAEPLPTAPLGGVPTVVSDTTNLTDTTSLITETPAAAATAPSGATVTPTPAAGATAASGTTPTSTP